ncbi:xanthine dehydrogenase accessory protein XdhC [Paracoccus xiamenensis]|uniref:xanthine dehydrogenase accessory protein XdhC n=1 Tax=Paracoccus xiamenensis TaxID=2714901 RepID=UPI00140982F1|nr:xanthine dehydrogenase accessory protein XdhC [Paracoccus xiamenensis]NHF74118.1 xanthine dehydrogenase accessory protein XdhC [Paracoccus xiamenensis]
MIRVRVTGTEGSTPRETGAEMLVTPDQITGTIGGGRMEYDVVAQARAMLASGEGRAVMTIVLGPDTGQCCGGRMQVVLERAAPSAPAPRPQVLIFGAGHVGRALARIMSKLPFEVALYDDRKAELAKALQTHAVLTALPEAAIRAARPGAAFVVLTHDHALDFMLTAEALKRGDAAYVGMIGSATKRARFNRDARAQGIDPAGLTCPIGAGFSADKRPELIAVFTAAEIAARLTANATVD